LIYTKLGNNIPPLAVYMRQIEGANEACDADRYKPPGYQH